MNEGVDLGRVETIAASAEMPTAQTKQALASRPQLG
jgi:hypothetical protein